MQPYQTFLHRFFQDRETGDFPSRFTVEATNHCNLHCSHCPQESSGRGYGHMDFDLYASLAKQAAGRDVLFFPQGLGEGFLHPLYVKMLQLTHDVGVRCPIVIANGVYFHETRGQALIDTEMSFAIISIDGSTQGHGEQPPDKTDGERAVRNTKEFLRKREQQEAGVPNLILRLVGCDESHATVDEFNTLWKPLLRESDEIIACSPVTWAGCMKELAPASDLPPESLAARPPCRMLYKTLTVYYDGRTTPCCYDHKCQLEVGNALETPIEEIWHGTEIQRLRRLHEDGRSGEIDICRSCQDHIP